jgi:acyl-coenzyme A thioesterase PaaI-like protein
MIKNKNDKILNNVRSQVHPRCIACGCRNLNGLHLQFETDDDGGVKSIFQCDESFEGYSGVLHGGIISTVLDGAMCHCIFALGHAAVTVEMTTRFRHPVVICREAIISARITRHCHPLYLLEAKIVQDGQVKATATGKFYDQKNRIEYGATV